MSSLIRRIMIMIFLAYGSGNGLSAGPIEMPATMAPSALLQAGNAAYMAQQWAEAAQHFQGFLDTYAEEASLADVVAQVRPLLALTRIRLGEYGAAGELIGECLALPTLEPAVKDELSFWKGIILLKAEGYEEARAAFLAYFQTPEFQALRRVETILLYGTTYVLENDHAKSAAFFEQQSQRLWELNHETALRAHTLRLHCLMETGNLAKALEVLKALQPLLGDVTQIVSLHGLTAELGGRFLDAGDYHRAIFCLQRVWAADRLLKHQEARIARLKMEIDSAGQHPGTEPLSFQKRSVLTRVERELRTFATNPNFDLGVRLRLGFAWLGLERYREAALVLEEAMKHQGDPQQLAQAGMAVVQCWHELKRYDRAIAAADAWLGRFAKTVDDDHVARVRFLLAQAHHDDRQFDQAARLFEALGSLHPRHDLAPQAAFMAGMCRMMDDDYEEALRVFAEVKRKFDKLPIAEDADYWEGMALNFQQEYEACREHMAVHLKRYGANARYAANACFRSAYCLFALGQYETAIGELRDYGRGYPEGVDLPESQILIGDALCSLGEIESGLEEYRSVTVDARHWSEEAQFKIGKVLKLRKDWDGLRDHFNRFVQEHPQSQRLAEAVYWAGFASISQDRLDEARSLYWQAIQTHGDKASHHGVEDILLALPHLYKGPEAHVELLREMQRTRSDAEAKKRSTLACRFHWLEGHMQPPNKTRLAQADFMMAASLLDVEKQNPRIIADCADASRAAGSKARARNLYADLIKWNPRAVEVERALAGLGFIAHEADDWREALACFARFEKRAVSTDLRPEVLMRKAQILAAQMRIPEAIDIYKQLLEDKRVPGRSKAEALMAWGHLWEKQGELLKATALYERVYLSYGRHRDLVGQAYLARGAVLERLGKKREAAEVYAELSKTEMLKGLAAYREGMKRLQPLASLLEETTDAEAQP